LIGILAAGTAEAKGKHWCPVPFTLRGGNINAPWKKVTPNAWRQMLPEGWVLQGGHFLDQVKDRGPKIGITTPSELASAIRDYQQREKSDIQQTDIRRRIVLGNIVNSAGKHPMVIYDYNYNSKTAKCELVTFTFPSD